MKSKNCTKCKEEKFLDEFSPSKRALDGKQSACKKCSNIASKIYYLKNKEKLKKYYQENKEKQKKYRQEHKEKIVIRHKKWYQEHKEKITIQHKIYRDNHKEEIKNTDKKYRQEHKKELNIQINKYRINRRKTDINFKISGNLRNRVRDAIKNNLKSAPTMKLLGCSINFLKQHLESQFINNMSWKNHGKGVGNKNLKEWHIDHIRPCASFDLSKPEEQRKCFHYSNLQPLWAKDNLSKGVKWKDKNNVR